MNTERPLTVAQVAERLQVTPKTVRRWLQEGRLRGVMLGGKRSGYRISELEVARLLSGESQEGKTKAAA